MKRKVAESLLLGALSVSVLVGCGSDKEVTKVDDNAVQSTEVSTGGRQSYRAVRRRKKQ